MIHRMLRRVARKDAKLIDPSFDVRRLPAGYHLYRCTLLGADNSCTIHERRRAREVYREAMDHFPSIVM